MRILRLKLVNFKRHKNLEVAIRPGLIGLTGPNGCGKSSFLSSMAYAITGMPLNDEPIRDLVTWGQKSGSVEMEFEHQGEHYTVTRPVGKTGAQLVKKEDDKFDIRGITPVTMEMQRMAGTPFDLFKGIMFVAQDALDAPLKGTDSARKEAFGRLFNCQQFDKLRDILQEGVSRLAVTCAAVTESPEEIAKEVQTLEATLESATQEVNALRERVRSYDMPALFRTANSTARDETALAKAQADADSLAETLASFTQEELVSFDPVKIEKDISHWQSIIRFTDTGVCPMCGHKAEKPPYSKEEATEKLQATLAVKRRMEQYRDVRRRLEYAKGLCEELKSATIDQADIDNAWTLIRQHETLEAELQKASSAEGYHRGNLEAAKRRYAEAVKRNESATRAKVTLENLEAVRNAFHRDAVQKEIRSYGARQINDRLQGYLSIFNLPYKPSFDNDGLMKFLDIQTGTEHEFSKLSGGEQKLTALAYRLALMQMFSGSVRVAILDEPTYGVDRQNLETMCESFRALAEYAGQRGLSIFVATHEEALMPSFDQIISL